MALLQLPPTKEAIPSEPSAYSEAGKYVSEAVYWEHYYEHPYFNYEWNNGVLEEVPVSNVIQFTLYKWFLILLDNYLLTYPIATFVALEMGFKLQRESGKTSIRKPDIGLVMHHNPIPLGDLEHTYKGTFDLCIESLSSSTKREIERDTVQKKGEYAQAGVREYYILDPEDEHMAFYYLTAWGTYRPILPTADGIIRSRVLPGFQFRYNDLQDRPAPIDMANDPIYQGFMLPEHQRLQERVDRAEQKLVQHQREADQQLEAKQIEIDQLRAQLKALQG